MRELRSLVLIVLLGVAARAAGGAEITILHVSDTHSHLLPWGPKDASLDGTMGGLARVATLVAAEPDALFVHAGDLFHGDIFFNETIGVAELQLLAAMGLDAFALGNHELQYGPELLTASLSMAWPPGAVPVLASNLVGLEAHPLGLWVTSTTLKTVNGVKVGIFGLITPRDYLAQPYPLVIDPDLVTAAQTAVASLRAQGADVVVCLAHLGLEDSRAVAFAAGGIDVVVNGHDHVALADAEEVPTILGGTTLIVSSGEYYTYLGRLRLAVDESGVTLIDHALLPVDAATPAAPPIAAVIAQVQAGIVALHGDVFHEVIGWAAEPIDDRWDARKAKRDTPLGVLFTDAYRELTRTDVAVEAAGFLDQELPAGPIVVADLYHAMDYGLPDPQTGVPVRSFQLVTFRMRGAQLLGALELALAAGGDLFPRVSGMRFFYDSRLPEYGRILVDTVRVGGHRFDPLATYSVTASEGLAYFLAGFGFELTDVVPAGASVVGAVQTFVEERGTIWAERSGRLRDLAAREGE